MRRHATLLLTAVLACAKPEPVVDTPAAQAVAQPATDLRDPGFREAGVPELPFAVGESLSVVLPAAAGGRPVWPAEPRDRKLVLHIFGSW